MTVYLNKGVEPKTVQQTLEYTNLRSVTRSVEISYAADDNKVKEDFVEWWNLLTCTQQQIRPWIVRFELKFSQLMNRSLQVSQIADEIESYFEPDTVQCIYSDENRDYPVILLQFLESTSTNDNTEQLTEFTELMLDNIILKGINGVKRVFMREENNEWILDTEGTNLLETMTAPGVDYTRTVSNNVIEVLETLGIEAARAALLTELKHVLSFDGSYVNHRHLAILVDVMTYRGHLMSITRHGVNRTETGALTRCSFEETADILLEAAAFSEIDNMKGVTDNVMIGQLAKLGTGHCDLFLDMDKLETIPTTTKTTTTTTNTTTTTSISTDYESGNKENIFIDYVPPEIKHFSSISLLPPSMNPEIGFAASDYELPTPTFYYQNNKDIPFVLNYDNDEVSNIKPQFTIFLP